MLCEHKERQKNSDCHLTFDKNLKFILLNFVTLQVNLEGQQECEDKLVVFIEAPHCVSKYLESQVFNNVCYSLLSFGGLLWPLKTHTLMIITTNSIGLPQMLKDQSTDPWFMAIKLYLASERSKILRNWASEVWYMTLTMLISVIRKYRMLPREATGRYLAWAMLILISASAATLSFALTSAAVCLVVLRIPIMESSSTRDPRGMHIKCYLNTYEHDVIIIQQTKNVNKAQLAFYQRCLFEKSLYLKHMKLFPISPCVSCTYLWCC